MARRKQPVHSFRLKWAPQSDAKKIRQKINESFGNDEIYSTSTFRHAEFNELRFNPKFKLERPEIKT